MPRKLFKVGDIVYLNSGSPPMIVSDVSPKLSGVEGDSAKEILDYLCNLVYVSPQTGATIGISGLPQACVSKTEKYQWPNQLSKNSNSTPTSEVSSNELKTTPTQNSTPSST